MKCYDFTDWGCNITFLSSNTAFRLRATGNRVLRTILASKKDEIIGG
jgi:hypothetical protein